MEWTLAPIRCKLATPKEKRKGSKEKNRKEEKRTKFVFYYDLHTSVKKQNNTNIYQINETCYKALEDFVILSSCVPNPMIPSFIKETPLQLKLLTDPNIVIVTYLNNLHSPITRSSRQKLTENC